MSVRDSKQLKILVVLLGILGLILFLGPRLNRPPTASVEVTTKQGGQEAAPAAVNDARIRLDLIDKNGGNGEAGRENLFQYRTTPAAPSSRPSVLRPGIKDPFAASPAPTVPATPPVEIRSTAPPAPPPIPLKYQGFARSDAGGGAITAFLVDSPNPASNEFSPHYNVRTGDVLLGRYRIAAVTDTSVEVDDLQYNRRQTLPLLK